MTADIPKLVEKIGERLKLRTAPVPQPDQRLSAILRDNIDRIVSRTLTAMKADAALSQLSLSDEERIGNLGAVLRELADHLDSGEPNEGSELLLRSARRRGEIRSAQQVPIDLMLRNERIIEQVINNIIYENLLAINLSYLFLDLGHLNDALLLQFEESIRAYTHAERQRRN